MKVNYNSDMREWIIEIPNYTYRISIIKCSYVLEQIKPPDSQLIYCTLGASLEAVMREEMHNAVKQ